MVGFGAGCSHASIQFGNNYLPWNVVPHNVGAAIAIGKDRPKMGK